MPCAIEVPQLSVGRRFASLMSTQDVTSIATTSPPRCHLTRRWARLAKMEKETTSMSGWFSVGDPYGSGRRRSASVTGPLMHCCLWRGSSMDDRSTVRRKFMLCQAPASTVCGKPWRVSSWSPVRAQQAVETTVTHTQSSKLHFSFSASVFFYFPLYLFLSLIISVPPVPFLPQKILWKQYKKLIVPAATLRLHLWMAL